MDIHGRQTGQAFSMQSSLWTTTGESAANREISLRLLVMFYDRQSRAEIYYPSIGAASMNRKLSGCVPSCPSWLHKRALCGAETGRARRASVRGKAFPYPA